MAEKSKDYAISQESGQDSGHGASSVLGTYFNVVCVCAGIGILGLPNAVSKGGWVSILFIVLCGIMAVYTSVLLIQCKYFKSGTRLETFSEIGEAAFGRIGRNVVRFCHHTILVGTGCLLIIVAGINMEKVGLYYGAVLHIRVWMVIAGLIVGVPYCAFRTMKEFVWMAVFGFLTTLITLIIVVTLSITSMSDLPPASTETIIFAGIPSSLSVFSLAYLGNIVHPHLEGSMKEPKKWPVALAGGLGTACSFYIIMSVTGYYIFGNAAKGTIFDSLPEVLPNYIARLFIISHVLLTTPIVLCSFGLESEELANITPEKMGFKKATLFRVIARGATIAILTLIAAFIPYFVEFMSLLGAFFNCALLYYIPIICHIKMFGFSNRSIAEYSLMFLTLIIATITFFWGGYEAIVGMAKAIKEG